MQHNTVARVQDACAERLVALATERLQSTRRRTRGTTLRELALQELQEATFTFPQLAWGYKYGMPEMMDVDEGMEFDGEGAEVGGDGEGDEGDMSDGEDGVAASQESALPCDFDERDEEGAGADVVSCPKCSQRTWLVVLW